MSYHHEKKWQVNLINVQIELLFPDELSRTSIDTINTIIELKKNVLFKLLKIKISKENLHDPYHQNMTASFK